jgi:hypothetical protein
MLKKAQSAQSRRKDARFFFQWIYYEMVFFAGVNSP